MLQFLKPRQIGLILSIFALPLSSTLAEVVQVNADSNSALEVIRLEQKLLTASKKSSYRGWDFLVAKLRSDNVPEHRIREVYQSRNMPPLTPVYFSLAPRESKDIYSNFTKPEKIALGSRLLKSYYRSFFEAERELAVDRHVVAAILLVETQGGRVLGNSLVINRLSRLAVINEPENVELNFRKLKRADNTVTFAEVSDRASVLEQMFYPEIPALLQIAERNKVNLLKLKGSGAGAFGIPQFLPTSYLQFGVDGNRDGIISLFEHADAIWSAANFLRTFGWNSEASVNDKKQVILKYNNSEAYADAVLDVAGRLAETEVTARNSTGPR